MRSTAPRGPIGTKWSAMYLPRLGARGNMALHKMGWGAFNTPSRTTSEGFADPPKKGKLSQLMSIAFADTSNETSRLRSARSH